MWYLVETTFACAGVKVDANNRIVETAPIYRKFLGQSFNNLREWAPVVNITPVP